MGDARIQYQLERTLPGLQLASKHKLFDERQLRKITSQRRDFERALVQRHVETTDYARYIKFEEDLEKLRSIRLNRALEHEEIPRQDMAKMRSEATHHIVSIYERGVKRCKYDVDFWLEYMRWAQQRRMRSAVSRISARSLALFPGKTQLWLAVADYELNGTMSTTTARALLQQALRLNAIPHQAQVLARQRNMEQTKPHKRARTGRTEASKSASSSAHTIRPAGNSRDDTPTLVISEKERELVRLWTEYIRMELVFIERLRRRRAVLNILDDDIEAESDLLDNVGKTAKDAGGDIQEREGEEEGVVPSKGEDEAPVPSIAKIVGNGKQSLDDSGSLLKGSIPAAAIISSVSLDSTSCLPPRTHLALLMGVGHMVRSFPCLGEATELKDHLGSVVHSALLARYSYHPAVLLYLSASDTLDQASKAGIQSKIEASAEDEMEQGSLLRSASKLSRKQSKEMPILFGSHVTENEARYPGVEPRSALLAVLRVIEDALGTLADDPVKLAHSVRAILVATRTKVHSLGAATSTGQYTSQLCATAVLARVSIGLGSAFAEFLAAWRERIMRDAIEARIDQNDDAYKAAVLMSLDGDALAPHAHESSSGDEDGNVTSDDD